MKELLEAGVHFGHQAKRWNPKMKRYIYATRNGIHVIDLNKAIPLIEAAYEFLRKTIESNKAILFVWTKKQAQEAVEEEAKRCGMFFVNQRWMGGTLTNFKTIKKNIARLNEIEKMKEDGTYDLLPKKEVILLEREHRKLQRGLGGIRQMTQLPGALFVVDTKKEQTAIDEALTLGIPIVAVVDTNADPDEVDYPVPGNDDAIRSIKLLTRIAAEAVLAGREARQVVDGEAEAGMALPVEDLVVEEVAEALSEEERIEEMGLADIKIEEDDDENNKGMEKD